MTTLHILSRSPFNDASFSSGLRLLAAGDALLLTGDAAWALQPGTAPAASLAALNQSICVLVLEEDLLARGLQAPAGVQVVDYAGFVALTLQHARVNSWL